MSGRRLTFFVAAAAGVATLSAASAPSPLYPIYQQLWGFSAFTLTVVFGVYVFALLAALLTVGSLSDRIGRRPVVGAALVLLAGGMLLFALAGSVGGLIAARIMQGFAVGAATGATTAMIVDSAPSPRWGSMISSAAPSLGIAAGSVVAGALVQFAPRPRQLVFWVLGAVYLVLAGLVLGTPGEPLSVERRAIWRFLRPRAALPAVARPVLVGLLPAMTATWALAGLYLSLGSSVLRTVVDVHSELAVGVVLAVFFLSGVVGAGVFPLLPTRLSHQLGLSTLAVGVIATITALPLHAIGLYAVGSGVAGIGFGASFRSVVTELAEVAPTARRGEVFATMYIVSYLSFSAPALIAGLAVERFGLENTAIGYGVVEVLLVVAAGVIQTRRRDDSEPLRSRTLHTSRLMMHYLECGPSDGPLLFLVHGWPGIGLMWRAQLEAFAADGWHCVAPDLRGFGASAAPSGNDAYAIREIVVDLTELHDRLGGRPAVWIGHDWGSIAVGALAAHEPRRVRGLGLVSWAYFPMANSLETLVSLVDRSIYPEDNYPDGQWDYYRYYTTNFDTAVADLDADPAASLASIFRAGQPEAIGQVAPSALITRNGGRFGAAHRAPPTRPDASLWPPPDFEVLVRGYARHGFGPPSALYTNDDANIAYARESIDAGRLALPVLFVNGEWDAICTIIGNHQGDPMRASCSDLTVTSIPGGHWLPLECREELTATIRTWLQNERLVAN